MKNKVLLVEDVRSMQLIVQSAISSFCELICVGSIAEAKKAIAVTKFDLAILDVQLPDGNGFDFCEELKRQAQTLDLPVIFLTGQAEVDDRVRGFALGAEDYILKPLEPKEFVARVQSKLKKKPKGTETSFTKAEFFVDLLSQKVFIGEGSPLPVDLTPIEFRLLVLFMKNEGQLFSREELISSIWGKSVHVSGHTVDTHISTLRKKIGEASKYIKSIVKKGYCFTLQVD